MTSITLVPMKKEETDLRKLLHVGPVGARLQTHDKTTPAIHEFIMRYPPSLSALITLMLIRVDGVGTLG